MEEIVYQLSEEEYDELNNLASDIEDYFNHVNERKDAWQATMRIVELLKSKQGIHSEQNKFKATHEQFEEAIVTGHSENGYDHEFKVGDKIVLVEQLDEHCFTFVESISGEREILIDSEFKWLK
ncbi:hypothetical protein [Priestia flexa]|uniref:hypothetical protein n=1 Tax=Priestia flexa TaxID=86664 RepID=UPI0004737DAF|nr:hypothetical protein [Priestia flexa]